MFEGKLRCRVSTRVSRLALAMLALATFVATGAATAQTYRIDYDAAIGTLPSAQGWTHFLSDPAPADGLSEANYSVSGGALIQGPTGGTNSDDANRQWYEATSPTFDFDDDVIEVNLRLRIVSSTITPPPSAGPRAGFGLSVADADGQLVILYIGSDSLFLYGSNQGTSELIPLDTTAGFVDYHLRIDASGASVSIAGDQLAYIPRNYYGLGSTPNRVSFGDLTTIEQSSSEVESIAFGRFNPPVAEVRNIAMAIDDGTPTSTAYNSTVAYCPQNPGYSFARQAIASGSRVLEETAHESTALNRFGFYNQTSSIGAANGRLTWPSSWSVQTRVVCGELPGMTDHSTFSNHDMIATSVSTDVSCPAGKVAFSGGGRAYTGSGQFATIEASEPKYSLGQLAGWRTSGQFDPTYGPWVQTTTLQCTDAKDLTVVTETTMTIGTTLSAVAICPSGQALIGGGGRVIGNQPGIRLVGSSPDEVFSSYPVAWVVQAAADPPETGFYVLWVEATAICVPLADPTVARRDLVGRWNADTGYPVDERALNDATFVNGASIVPGLLDDAFSFDATNQEWLSIPGEDFYPAGPFTVDAFFQTSTSSVEVTTIASLYDIGGINAGTPNYSAWAIQLTPEGFASVYFRTAFGAASASVVGTEVLTDGAPHHIALVRELDPSGRRLELWVDGERVGFTVLTIGTHTNPLQPSDAANPDPVSVGAHRLASVDGVYREFDGLIDDLKFYDRALTREEIENIAGCGVPIVPRVLNLDASRFGGPPDVPNSHRLCVYLEAGSYDVTMISPAEDPLARFTAWSDSGTGDWGTAFTAVGESSVATGTGIPIGAPSMQLAFDNTPTKTISFSLAAPERVYFGIEDGAVIDNQGGVSLRIEAPEPGFGAMLVSGIALLGGLGRRRSIHRPVRGRP